MTKELLLAFSNPFTRLYFKVLVTIPWLKLITVCINSLLCYVSFCFLCSFELLFYGLTQNIEYINLYEYSYFNYLYLSIIFYDFSCNFTSHGTFEKQQIINHLTNLHFLVACVGQPKAVLRRNLGTSLGSQNYELLDFIL